MVISIILVSCGKKFEIDTGYITTIQKKDKENTKLEININYERPYKIPESFQITKRTKITNKNGDQIQIEDIEIFKEVTIRYKLLDAEIIELKENE